MVEREDPWICWGRDTAIEMEISGGSRMDSEGEVAIGTKPPTTVPPRSFDDEGRIIRFTEEEVRARNAIALAALGAIAKIGDAEEQRETLDYLIRAIDRRSDVGPSAVLPMRVVVLDTGTLGRLTHPRARSDAIACQQWAHALLAAGIRVIVPGIADYEVRRELIRAGKASGIRRLDAARIGFEFEPITQADLDEAASPWAMVWNAGLSMAQPAALDGDAILAAQTRRAAGPGDVVTIATDNPPVSSLEIPKH
jgi:hypothetical protein